MEATVDAINHGIFFNGNAREAREHYTGVR
jgi:hypothetical protein